MEHFRKTGSVDYWKALKWMGNLERGRLNEFQITIQMYTERRGKHNKWYFCISIWKFDR